MTFDKGELPCCPLRVGFISSLLKPMNIMHRCMCLCNNNSDDDNDNTIGHSSRFSWSPLCATNYLQHTHPCDQGAVRCKSTLQVLFACNMVFSMYCRPAYLFVFDSINTEISPQYGSLRIFLDILTDSSRNNGNHSVNKFGVVASEIDCQALMELPFIDICMSRAISRAEVYARSRMTAQPHDRLWSHMVCTSLQAISEAEVYVWSTIFRLRSGHCQLLAHLNRLKISYSDECPCNTVPHILQSCLTYDALRRQTWPSPVDAHRKLWGPVETLRQTADFALLTGLKI